MKKAMVALLASASIAGCASIIQGDEAKINIISEDGVKIYVDGVKVGVESAIATVDKGEPHFIRVEKEGCKPIQVQTGEKFDTTSLLGILIDFGIISIPVDLMTGAAWKVSPQSYNITPDCTK